MAGIFGALGLIGVAATFYLTLQSNRIARDTAKRQLRAYVSFESGAISNVASGAHVTFHFEFRNSGQTPCKILASATGIGFEPLPIIAVPQLAPELTTGSGTEGPSCRWPHSIATRRAVTLAEFQAYQAGSHGFVGSCEIRYEDIFGAKQKTLVTVYRTSLSELPPPQVSVLHLGNEAT